MDDRHRKFAVGSNHHAFKRSVGPQSSYLSSIFSSRVHLCDTMISSHRYALLLLPKSLIAVGPSGDGGGNPNKAN
jgi:hypothetical protein